MSLTRPQYEQLVARLERFGHKYPALLRVWIGALALLGLLYIPFVILCTLALIGLSLTVVFTGGGFFLWPLLFLLSLLFVQASAAIKAFRIRSSPPDGLIVTRDDAPRLFAMLDELSAALKAPPLYAVILSSNFNAGVTQVPRLGWLGWYRNYLFLSLPMMASMSPQEFRILVTHELEHLARQHSRFAGRISRVRVMWQQFMEHMGKQSKRMQVGVASFFNWFVPRFDAHAFALARLDEIEADRRMGEELGGRAAAQTHVHISVLGHYVSAVYWSDVRKLADSTPSPPKSPVTALLAILKAGVPTEALEKALQEELAKHTACIDPHPSLADRLSTLGYAPTCIEGTWRLPEGLSLPVPPPVDAARDLLGESTPRMAEWLDQAWWLWILRFWKQGYDEVGKAREKLQLLEAHSEETPVTADTLYEQAALTHKADGEEAATPLYRRVLEKDPQYTVAHYALAQILLKKKDYEGLTHLNAVIERDPDGVIPACRLAYDFLVREERPVDAQRYRDRAEQHQQMLEKAEEERKQFLARDTYLPHGLDKEEVEALVAQLTKQKAVKAAYLVRKQLMYLPERPCYLLAILHKPCFIFGTSSWRKKTHQIAKDIHFARRLMVIILAGNFERLKKPVRRVPGGLIYTQARAKR